MNNFLKNNQKSEIRAKISESVILYEPTIEQKLEIREILLKQESLKTAEGINIEGEIDYKPIRYIIRNCCKEGDFIDEYTDEQLELEFENGNWSIKKLQEEIILLIQEILEEVQYEVYQEFKNANSIINLFNRGLDEKQLYDKLAKLLKKQGVKLTADELEKYKNEPEKLVELIEGQVNKINKTKKKSV